MSIRPWSSQFVAIRLIAITLALTPQARGQASSEQPSKVTIDQNGAIHVPAYVMPLSAYMSNEAKREYIDLRLHWPPDTELVVDNTKTREAMDSHWLMPLLEKARAVYEVTVKEERIAGIRTDVVTPKAGVAKHNADRVLINLHGGGFFMGAGPLQLIEAIPIAATARIKVISIDFRQGPNHKFPAASEDVAAVYRELLKEYKPQSIGIYGQSTGGTLVAMSIAWFQKENLPRPGAIGIFSAPGPEVGGDSVYTATPLSPLFGSKSPAPSAAPNNFVYRPAYLAEADVSGPLVSPTLHPEILAKFPPTLIVTGTRDPFASTLIHMHRQLVRVGVDAQLQMWEGMWHGFLISVDLPESKEVYDVTATFFDSHLGETSQ